MSKKVANCCCFQLKTGTLIIAFLGCIGSIINIARFLPAIFVHLIPATLRNSDQQPELQFNDLNIIVCSVVTFIVHSLLVVGVYEKSTSYFYPFLIYLSLQITIVTLGTIIFFLFVIIHEFVIVEIGTFAILACASGILWYFWIVVCSYYHEIKVETERVSAPACPTAKLRKPPPNDEEAAPSSSNLNTCEVRKIDFVKKF